MDEKQLAKLIKKNVDAVEKARKNKQSRTYDSTLTRKDLDDNDLERQDFFDQMKKREF